MGHIFPQELALYKVQLQTAQREIFRAQEIINQVAEEKLEAEGEAARARTKARQLLEDKLIMLAREEGQRQGYREGLLRNNRMNRRDGGIGDRDERDEESVVSRRSVERPDSRIAVPKPIRATSRYGDSIHPFNITPLTDIL